MVNTREVQNEQRKRNQRYARSKRACIGHKGERGKIAYVTCRYDGDLTHVGRILAEHYNDLAKALELLLGGVIVSLRNDVITFSVLTIRLASSTAEDTVLE